MATGISCCWAAVPSSESGLKPLAEQRHLRLSRKRPLHYNGGMSFRTMHTSYKQKLENSALHTILYL